MTPYLIGAYIAMAIITVFGFFYFTVKAKKRMKQSASPDDKFFSLLAGLLWPATIAMGIVFVAVDGISKIFDKIEDMIQ
jgi:hypothetical protein